MSGSPRRLGTTAFVVRTLTRPLVPLSHTLLKPYPVCLSVLQVPGPGTEEDGSPVDGVHIGPGAAGLPASACAGRGTLSLVWCPLLNKAHTALHLFSQSFVSASQPATSAE